MGFFDLFSSKEKKEEFVPEVRRMPDNGEEWVVTQVFADQKEKDKRYYYGLRKVDSSGAWMGWKLEYSVKDPADKKADSGDNLCTGPFTTLLDWLLGQEKAMAADPKLKFVPGLKGNYVEAANARGLHFSQDGKCFAVKQDDKITVDAFFKRSSLIALYQVKKPELKEPAVKTWDDYYKEVVHRFPIYKEDAEKIIPLSRVLARNTKSILEEIKILEKLILDKGASGVSSDAKGFSLYNMTQKRVQAHEDPALEYAEYHYNVIILTALLRMGGKAYKDFSEASLSLEYELNILKKVSETIRAFAEGHFSFSKERVDDLVNLVMQGPDPYSDRSLPLEEAFEKSPTPAAVRGKPASAPKKIHYKGFDF